MHPDPAEHLRSLCARLRALDASAAPADDPGAADVALLLQEAENRLIALQTAHDEMERLRAVAAERADVIAELTRALAERTAEAERRGVLLEELTAALERGLNSPLRS